MIRFCDKEVQSIYSYDIQRSQLLTYFLSNNRQQDIILVYDENASYVGYISYESLLEGKGNDIVIDGKLYCGEDIFDKAKKAFASNSTLVYLPVLNAENELIYFCYDDHSDKTHYQEQEVIFNQLEKATEYYFIENIWPQVQKVYIYDMNEFAYRWYRVLKMRNFPVAVIGEKWGNILSIEDFKNDCPDFARMNVYAEGTPFVQNYRDINWGDKRFEPTYSFNFLSEIAWINRLWKENVVKQKLLEKGINVALCRIPSSSDIEGYDEDEYIRSKNNITIPNGNSKFLFYESQVTKILGIEWEKYIENINKTTAEKSVIKIEDEYLDQKMYGNSKNKLFLIGPCIVYGTNVCEYDSLAVKVEEELTQKGYDYSVYAITVYFKKWDTLEHVLQSLKIRKNDIVCLIFEQHFKECFAAGFEDKFDLDLAEFYNNRPEGSNWFWDKPIHTTAAGNKAVAGEIFKKTLEPVLSKMDFTKESSIVQYKRTFLSEREISEIKKYLQQIQEDEFAQKAHGKIGSIIMNCNPFTYGHRYLIEHASKQVDYLYIFVVEEDRSYFKFEDRLEMVRKGTEDLGNVRVLPSGKFILSYSTFQSYFQKEEQKDITVDASDDINIFAEYIAPKLNISMRFVGEEPIDKITNQYNRQMEEILRAHGIEFVEIPRKSDSTDNVISASRVRQFLKEKNMDAIKELVPESTYIGLQKYINLVESESETELAGV
jgi:cytidyltransferase-related domain